MAGVGGTAEPDDRAWLLEPAIEPGRAEPWDVGPAPWRLRSQVYVAFFGGVVAVTAIALLNARRLGVDASRRRLIVVLGALALAAVVVLTSVLVDAEITREGARSARMGGRVISVILYFALAALQRTRDRVFSLRNAEYSSLWGAGLLAALLGGAVQGAVVIGVLFAR